MLKKLIFIVLCLTVIVCINPDKANNALSIMKLF